MVSVLIPVYNYNIRPLVENLLIQFESINCKWEVFLSDDNSDSTFKNLNSNYIDWLDLKNVKLFQQDVNVGNAANRNYLIEKASYGWLLFLDVDVLPVNIDFLAAYLSNFKSTNKELISGNIIYDSDNPKPSLLRWKYGKQKEEVSIEVRKDKPILNLRGANFAIRKSLAEKFKMPILKEKYGFVDTRFFLQFDVNQVCVIENPVYHLGIESNDAYLNKTKKAISNALFLMDTDNQLAVQLKLVSSYKKVRFSRFLLVKIYNLFSSYFVKNLTSKNPSIFVFQIFKILYLSSLDVSKNG